MTRRPLTAACCVRLLIKAGAPGVLPPHRCAACSLRRRVLAEVVGYAAWVALACALWSLRVVEGRRKP